MKKILVVLIVALVVLTSASAFKFKSVGVEAGRGFYIAADMDIVDEKLDAYARFGIENFVTAACFNLSLGGQFKVSELKIEATVFDVKPGVQVDFDIADGSLLFSLLGTCQFIFDNRDFSAFLRPGLGFSAYPDYEYDYKEGTYHKKTSFALAWAIEAGVAYLL